MNAYLAVFDVVFYLLRLDAKKSSIDQPWLRPDEKSQILLVIHTCRLEGIFHFRCKTNTHNLYFEVNIWVVCSISLISDVNRGSFVFVTCIKVFSTVGA